MYVKNLEIYASNGHAQILEKLNKAHMPINREEIMTYTDKHIRRKIIVIEYLLDELMLTSNGRSKSVEQCAKIDILTLCQDAV
jgi:hypothetical protein